MFMGMSMVSTVVVRVGGALVMRVDVSRWSGVACREIVNELHAHGLMQVGYLLVIAVPNT